jgi:hypothetical protein
MWTFLLSSIYICTTSFGRVQFNQNSALKNAEFWVIGVAFFSNILLIKAAFLLIQIFSNSYS